MQITENSSFSGNLTVLGTLGPPRARAELATETGTFTAPMIDWRVHDAAHTNLPGTPASDDLGLIGTTFGTDVPYISTGDLKNAGSTTRYARRQFILPPEYVTAGSVKIRVNGGMKTTVASVAATVDLECYLSARDGTKTGSDLCATAAISINSLTYANCDFTITATGLAPGNVLDVRMAILVNDSGTGTAVIGTAGDVQLLCDIRG